MNATNHIPHKPVFRTIKLRTQKDDVARVITSEHGIDGITGRILAARGFEAGGKLGAFLNPTLREGLPEPFGLKNLEASCAMIAAIVKHGGKIAVCSDFDVDGLSGSSQVTHFLRKVGAQVEVFVPDRFADGYGLNEKMIRQAKERGCELVLTIDFGTTNVKELELARELGLKTIVLDHHHVAEDGPPADLFINPQQKGCGFAEGTMCASGLSWYLILGLREFIPGAKDIDARTYLELACLGTICDMVPLIGVNRVIARRGLERIGASEWAGINALKNVAGIKKRMNCSDISFGLGPRLNAAGRLEHGEVVVELLTTTDERRALKIAHELDKLNTERQDTEAEVREHAVEQLLKLSALPDGIVVWDKKYHTGVIGIVAQRLTEQFYRPTAVMGQDNEGILKGSVRGIKGFSVVEALGSVSKHLIKFGGHSGAGGFSVEEKKVKKFAEAFNEECAKRLAALDRAPFVEADTEAALGELTPKLVGELTALSPFGVGNPQPSILVRGLKVMDLRVLKDTHLRTTLSDGKKMITGLMWRHKSHPALKIGNQVDVACRPETSTFSGILEIQANLQAVEVAR